MNAGELAASSLAQTSLLGIAFDALKSDALFEEAADLICDVVHETQEIDDSMDVIQLIVLRLITLRPQLATLSGDQNERHIQYWMSEGRRSLGHRGPLLGTPGSNSGGDG